MERVRNIRHSFNQGPSKRLHDIDDHFQTTCAGVYAIRDVAQQPGFTHVFWEDYRRLKAILCGDNRSRSDRVLGYAVYTEPQVGRVGMTLEQAQRIGSYSSYLRGSATEPSTTTSRRKPTVLPEYVMI